MLTPYRVLDLTDDRGAFAGFLLAQLGADVISVEPPGGHRTRHRGPWAGDHEHVDLALSHWAYSRGKRSVTVDEDREIEELAAGADVIIESGVFGIDLAALRLRYPGLVTTSLSPFGATGPKANWLGPDIVLAAASGQLALNGYRDRAPVRISVPQVWVNAGAEAACGVLMALTDRRQTGMGQHVDVSAQEAMMLTAQGWLAPALAGSPSAQRSGGGLQLMGKVDFRFVYPCRDGHVCTTFLPGSQVGPYVNKLMAWALNHGHLRSELAALDWTTLVEDYPVDQVAAIVNETSDGIAAAFAERTKADIFAMAQTDGLLIVPVATPTDLLATEQFEATGFWDEVNLGVMGDEVNLSQPIRFPGPWAHTNEAPLVHLGAPPRLGQHTERVKAEIASDVSTVPARRPANLPVSAARIPADDPKADRPLAGVRIIDATWVYAGPYSTRMLAYYGADVIRLESQTRPDQIRGSSQARVPDDTSGEASMQWHSINADKLGFQINLKSPKAREVVLDLVRNCDVIIDAFAPGVLERMELTHADFLAVNPRVIAVSTTLFGYEGPLSRTPGFGNMAAAMVGYYELTGWPDRMPAGPFLAYTDATSPRLTAAIILAALDWRERTGKGMSIDFSQAEGGIHFLNEAMVEAAVNGRNQQRRGNDDDQFFPHGVFPAGTPGADRWIAIACEDDEQWGRLAAIIERPDLASLDVDERRAQADAVTAAITAYTQGQDPAVLQERLQAAGVAAHQVQNSPEVVTDPQLLHRDHFHEVPHELFGHTWADQYGFRLSRSNGTPRRPGPMWGEHNFEILSELLGYDGEQIADLVIGGLLE